MVGMLLRWKSKIFCKYWNMCSKLFFVYHFVILPSIIVKLANINITYLNRFHYYLNFGSPILPESTPPPTPWSISSLSSHSWCAPRRTSSLSASLWDPVRRSSSLWPRGRRRRPVKARLRSGSLWWWYRPQRQCPCQDWRLHWASTPGKQGKG